MIEKAHERGGIAAFFAESILGCAGQVCLPFVHLLVHSVTQLHPLFIQIVYPENYLAQIYEKVRSCGGVCVADEVQTGFGRTGNGMWAFQLQNVIPDIVTLGKRIYSLFLPKSLLGD